MLVIRLRRTGKKNKPSYRIVVAEHSFPVNGRFTADLGFYNPHTKETGLKKDDVKAWLDKGAQPSNTVARILTNEKVKHSSVVVIKKNKKSKQTEADKAAPVAAPTSVAEAMEEAPAESETTPEVVEETTETAAPEETPAV